MGASNSKGIEVLIATSAATGTSLTFTGVTKAAPAVVSVADVTALVEGEVIMLAADTTGMASLDGKYFVITNIDGTAKTFELAGTDTTADDAFTAGTDAKVYLNTALQRLCLSSLTYNASEPEQIATGTFCDPQASISSIAGDAGTVEMTGFIDINDAGYKFIIDACKKETIAFMKEKLPNNGWIVSNIKFSNTNWSTPLDGALGFTTTANLQTKPEHVW